MAKLSIPSKETKYHYRYLIGYISNILVVSFLWMSVVSYYCMSQRDEPLLEALYDKPYFGVAAFIVILLELVTITKYTRLFFRQSHDGAHHLVSAFAFLLVSIVGGLLFVFRLVPEDIGENNVLFGSLASFQIFFLDMQKLNQEWNYRKRLQSVNGFVSDGVAHAAYTIHQCEKQFKSSTKFCVSRYLDTFIRNAFYARLSIWLNRLSEDGERESVVKEMLAYRNFIGVNEELKDDIEWLATHDFVDAPMPRLELNILKRNRSYTGCKLCRSGPHQCHLTPPAYDTLKESV